jgi:hypothetical protein
LGLKKRCHLFFHFFTNSVVSLSAYILFKDVKAQIQVGIQPIIVSAIRQIIPEPILPCNIKDNHGRKKKKAKRISYFLFIFLFVKAEGFNLRLSRLKADIQYLWKTCLIKL